MRYIVWSFIYDMKGNHYIWSNINYIYMPIFSTNEIPYERVARFGISKQMIEDLPEAVMSDILDGNVSPSIKMTFVSDDGHSFSFKSRFSLLRSSDGGVDVQLYPGCRSYSQSMIPDLAGKELVPGEVYIASVPDMNGELVKGYVQMDMDGLLRGVPCEALEANIERTVKAYHLTDSEAYSLRNGSPVTFILLERPVTIGLDLKHKNRLRLEMGDSNDWKEVETREYDKYMFGLNGCWVEQEDGSLDYVDEADFTDDILEEQRKQTSVRMQQAGHKM